MFLERLNDGVQPSGIVVMTKYLSLDGLYSATRPFMLSPVNLL